MGELVGFLKRLAGFLSMFALLEFVFRHRWLMPVLVFAFVGWKPPCTSGRRGE